MRKLSNDELGRKSVDEFRVSGKSPFIIILDNIRSFHNVGSVFRSADAFLVEAVYLCGITGTPPHREIQKTALGATESVYWKYYKTTLEAIDELKSHGYEIISLEQAENSVSLRDFQPETSKKYAMVFGHEINGVAQDVVDKSDHVIEIPQFGTKHSFNISVTAGIVLWDLYNKLD